MPLYAYQCGCGLRFERRRPLSEASSSHPCPSCEAAASRAPSTVRLAYGTEGARPGPARPGNTGLTGMDDVPDRAIGAAAKAGWDVARARRRDKLAVLAQNPDAAPTDLRNAGDHYEVMPRTEAAFRDRADRMVDPARQALTEAARKSREATERAGGRTPTDRPSPGAGRPERAPPSPARRS